MRTIALTLGVVLWIGAVPTARAQDKALQILKKYEKKYTNYKAVYNKMKLYVNGELKAVVETKSKHSGQRVMKMLFPGDIKGMHILVQSKDEMYIYLPAYRKVRRIAGHVRNQGFMGSGFTYDDMAINLWSKTHNVRLVKETRTHWTLDLKAKPGQSPLYRHIRMRIRKDLHLCDQFQYFNQHGRNFKTQYFQRYKCVSDNSYCMPLRIVMVEHTRGNRKSVLKVVKYRRKRGYPDRMFTIRYLLRSAN